MKTRPTPQRETGEPVTYPIYYLAILLVTIFTFLTTQEALIALGAMSAYAAILIGILSTRIYAVSYHVPSPFVRARRVRRS
ncbi:MAG TPA: hypothetical protein VGC39_01050 [Candidatus Methylacidiphilales bacterium]